MLECAICDVGFAEGTPQLGENGEVMAVEVDLADSGQCFCEGIEVEIGNGPHRMSDGDIFLQLGPHAWGNVGTDDQIDPVIRSMLRDEDIFWIESRVVEIVNGRIAEIEPHWIQGKLPS